MLILPAGTTKIDGPSWMPTDITPFDPTFSEDSVPEEIFPVDIQHYPTDHDYEFVNDDDDDLISVEEKEGINPIENLFNENVLLAQSFPLFGYLLGAADGAKCDDQVAVIDQFCTQLQQATIDSDLLTFQEENILQENFLKDAPSLLRNSFHQLMRQIITPVGELSPVELSFQVNQEIVKPIRACVSYLVKFLQKGTNFLAFEEEMGKKTIDNILENLTTILKEKGRFLYDWCEQRVSEWDHELYVNLFTIHKKSFQLTNLMKLFLIGAKCEGDFDEIRDYIDDFKIMKGMIEEIDEKFRSDFAYLDFLHHQVPEFDRNVAEIDLEELCYKLGSKKWSDTDEWINHYWLLSFSVDNNHFDVDPKYTHVCELHRETGRIYVLHRRSFHLAQDPPHLKATWNNWHGDEMKTVDFAVRDECNGIDVVNITLKQLIDQCHIKARLGAKECKTVITTGQMDFCSFGEHPNAAGRVIRMFNRISIFIGF
ncbi:unnamed protein product, partial [Mesorhabditis belari]|uniref:Uncharacterized protein n=1 Tax=Mesorhabditis belari TaxID=2138241 RepID=A0AAF3J2M8_9BILA